MSRRLPVTIILLAVCLINYGGCDRDPTEANQVMKAQPVTVLQLEDKEFTVGSRYTGSVSLYRNEKVGFEVAGRVLSVLDEGVEVEGPAFDEQRKLVRPGDEIARISDTRYRQRVEAVQARLKAAQREVEAVKATVTLAHQTLTRQKRILAKGAGSQQSVDEAQGNYNHLRARLAERENVVRAIREDFNLAQEDLVDTTLRAPFSGRVTRIHVSQGAVVEAGTPVVTLSLMDPIQVQVAVSANEERKIRTGDQVVLLPKDPVYPDGEPARVHALVYEKGSVADPDTRTFSINLIARNERRRIEQIDPQTEGLPVVIDFLPVVRHYQGEGGKLFVHTDSIYREDGDSFVLRLPGVSFHPGARRSAVGKHVPDKVKVTLGDEYFSVIKWNFRSLKSSGNLREGDFLVINPIKEHLTGLAIGRSPWLLRPGDLVPVSFLLHTTPKGLYVPVDVITIIDNKHVVYVVEQDTARATEVTVHETYRELRRIEGAGIAPGTHVIVGGMHYLSDGQPVTIVGEEHLPL